MKFKIKSEVFEKFPNLIVAIPVILGFDNLISQGEALQVLRQEEDELKKRFTPETLFEDKKVISYLNAFKKFGIDPEIRLPAHVALSKRVLEGGNLPDINPMVNLYNAMSIKYTTPFGGEDLSSLYGDFVLKFADGTEKWTPISGGKAKQVIKGDLVWGDDLDVSTPSLNWRQCERTKLSTESKDGYFIMDGFSDVNRDVIEKASKEFVDLTTKLFGGEADIYWLDKDHLEVEVPYKTKVIKNLKSSTFKGETLQGGEVKVKGYIGVAKEIGDAIKKVTGLDDVQLEVPENQEHGDYSTNVAMKITGKSREVKGKTFEKKNSTQSTVHNSPRQIAEEIKEKLIKLIKLTELIEKIEIAGPGFINFFLKKEIYYDTLDHITKQSDTFGKSDLGKGRKIMVEFAHPNTHKAFHIGHLRNISTGESIARILEFSGYEIIRANYQGDVGIHIAKALWGIKKLGFKDPKEVKSRVEFLGKAYATGATAFEDDETAKKEIHEINKKIYSKEDVEGNKLYSETRKWSLDYFESIYARVYTKFDRFYFESECYESGKKYAFEGLEKGILKKSDGAIIFPGSEYELHDRVFITKEGVPTYEAKDLGLIKLQLKEFNPDLVMHVLGPEQLGYTSVIFKAQELLFPETKGKQLHVPYGWVRLKEGKMSSRTGQVILGESLLNDAKNEIEKGFKSDEKTAEEISVGAVKYSFLKVGREQDIAFDLKDSVSLEGNSGPYLQYTYARTQSVLANVNGKWQELKVTTFKGLPLQGGYSNELNKQISKYPNKKNMKHLNNEAFEQLNNEEELVLRTLIHFPEIVAEAAKKYAPNLICNYLYDLAQKFNTFYNKHRILVDKHEALSTKSETNVKDQNSNDQKVSNLENSNLDIRISDLSKQSFRLALTKATGQVLKNGLQLLGIQAPERM